MSVSEDGGRRPSYMEQENEWEREGLLDPAWEQQQKKVRYLTELFTFRAVKCYNRCLLQQSSESR